VSATAVTPDDRMTVAASRALRDGDVCFVGIGLPSTAANLARRTHAPDLVLIYEAGAIGAKPDRLPLSIGDGILATTATAVVSHAGRATSATWRCPVSNDARTDHDPFVDLQGSSEFAELRSRFRKFVFPLTALFLAWYFLYVLLSTYAPAFMSTKVFGNVNIGLILGLGQFVSTFVITIIYVRWADREFDPRAAALAKTIGEDKR